MPDTITIERVRLKIRGGATKKITDLLSPILAEQGLQLDRIIPQPTRIGMMDAADIFITVVISVATAVAANYAQDKHLSAKIDDALARVRASAAELIEWSRKES